MDKIEQQRLAQLENCIPNIWDAEKALYIGANKTRFHFKDKLSKCTIVEIDPDACEYLHDLGYEVINEDIRDFQCRPYDLILWSHGPETIPREDLNDVIWDLYDNSKLLVLMCPWGKYYYPEGHVEDYPNITLLYISDFVNSFGQGKLPPNPKISISGNKDENGSNLVVYYDRRI